MSGFNQQAYETIYGFDTLDVLHNFFPEVLYDANIFQNEMLSWMRYRLGVLFAPTYVRQQSLYRIYDERERRAHIDEWRSQQVLDARMHLPPPIGERHVPAPANTPSASAVHTSRVLRASSLNSAPRDTPYRTPIRNTSQRNLTQQSMRITPVPIIRSSDISGNVIDVSNSVINITAGDSSTPTLSVANSPPLTASGALPRPRVASVALPPPLQRPSIQQYLAPDPLEELLSMLIPSNTNLFNILNTTTHGTSVVGAGAGAGRNYLWEDVPILPTNAQIEAGSELVEHTTIPSDVLCAVCQEHGIIETRPWRKLKCQHTFHNDCILEWFRRDVHCPICRDDIRTIGVA